MSNGIIYSGPSGDQYEKWKAEQLAIQAAAEDKTVEAEVVEEVKPKTVAKKPAAK